MVMAMDLVMVLVIVMIMVLFRGRCFVVTRGHKLVMCIQQRCRRVMVRVSGSGSLAGSIVGLRVLSWAG